MERIRRGVLLAPMAVLVTALAACSSSATGGGGAGQVSSGAPNTPASSGVASAPDKGIATDSPAPTAASSPARSTTADDRDAQLTAQTNGEPHTLVPVPGGFEAAVYDQQGTIEFWAARDTAAQWARIGASSYPVSSQLGPPQAQVTGALLTGMTHATFIVHGVFTGDSSGNAIAYTDGANGWGAIKAEPSGNIGPSGKPVGSDEIGLSFDFGFVDGKLQTKDCPTNRPIADCGSHAVTKLWVWTGSDFRLA